MFRRLGITSCVTMGCFCFEDEQQAGGIRLCGDIGRVVCFNTLGPDKWSHCSYQGGGEYRKPYVAQQVYICESTDVGSDIRCWCASCVTAGDSGCSFRWGLSMTFDDQWTISLPGRATSFCDEVSAICGTCRNSYGNWSVSVDMCQSLHMKYLQSYIYAVQKGKLGPGQTLADGTCFYYTGSDGACYAAASSLISPSPMCASISPYEYAYLSSVVYGDMDISGLTSWSPLPPASAGILTGFYGQLFNKSGTFVLAIRGTDGYRDWLADISLASTGKYLSYYIDQAISYLNTSLRNQNTKCLTFTGHSLGAALAEVLAGKYESSSIGFENPGAANYMKIQNIPNGNVTAYQASPNLINTLDTSAVSTIYRLFPDYTYPYEAVSDNKLIQAYKLLKKYYAYTKQQHSMIGILLQFNSVTGEPYIFSNQTNAWRLFSEGNGYTGFFKRYDLNSYYWLNVNNALLRGVLDNVSTSLNTAYNFVITGSDNHDDLLWGAGDYDDILEGKSGNDQYWAFNGVNNINDESGNDVYHFFTTNMQGITTINDGDSLGSITLDNYGNCKIQSLGIVLANIVDTGNVVAAFYPNDPNTGCQPDSTFSSQAYGILNNYHNNNIFFLQLSGQNLMISLNSIAINASKHGNIVITNFQDGSLGISLNVADRPISNPKIYYVSVTPGEVLKCDINQDSYLFGLVGSNIYMNYENNPYNCVMVGNSDTANTFIFTSVYVKGQNVKIHPSVATGTSTIQGYKSGDLIDVSALNSSSVAFQQDVGIGQVTMTCSHGVTILLPSVYNNISYTLDGKNNLTFVPNIVSPFNTTTITTTLTASQAPTPTNSDTNTDAELLAVSSYNSLTYPSSSPSAVAGFPSLSMASIASSPASPSPVVSSVKDYTSSACINQPLLIGFIKTTRTKTEYLLNYAKNIIDVWMNDDNFIQDKELLADKNNAIIKKSRDIIEFCV